MSETVCLTPTALIASTSTPVEQEKSQQASVKKSAVKKTLRRLTVLQQETNHVDLSKVSRGMQRSVALFGLLRQVGVVLRQDGSNIHSVILCTEMDRCESIL